MKNKTILITLLCLATLVSFFLPNFISSYKENERLKTINHWEFKELYQGDFDSAYFVNILTQHKFSGGTSIHVETQKNDTDISSLATLLEKIIGSNMKYIDSLIQMNPMYNEKNSILLMVDNVPSIFTFINVYFSNEYESLEIVYEERTSTIVSFYLHSRINDYTSTSLVQSFDDYAREHLGLSSYFYLTQTENLDGLNHFLFTLIDTKEEDIQN